MTTVYDKLKVFSECIIENVKKGSEEKLVEFSSKNMKRLQEERDSVIEEAQAIVDTMKRKAESEKQQQISRAQIDKQYALLRRKKNILDKVIDDTKSKAIDYTKSPEYFNFLKSCIDRALSQIEAQEVMILFKKDDLDIYKDKIDAYINGRWFTEKKVSIGTTDNDILGGCICEDKDKTLRLDCSILSMIVDSEELIGKILMDNLI